MGRVFIWMSFESILVNAALHTAPFAHEVLGLTPNQIVYVNVIVRAFSIYMLYRNPRRWAVTCAILFFSLFLDDLDGCIARQYKLTSEFGSWLDHTTDNIWGFVSSSVVVFRVWRTIYVTPVDVFPGRPSPRVSRGYIEEVGTCVVPAGASAETIGNRSSPREVTDEERASMMAPVRSTKRRSLDFLHLFYARWCGFIGYVTIAGSFSVFGNIAAANIKAEWDDFTVLEKLGQFAQEFIAFGLWLLAYGNHAIPQSTMQRHAR